jgi:signal transduction histidine kinase
MIIREAVQNAALHGRPRRIVIDLTYGGDELAILVSDDGIGFDTKFADVDRESHYGIAGMRERVDRMHGRIELMSAPGQGTVIHVRLRRALLVSAAAGRK